MAASTHSFGRRLARLRDKAGLTQEALAERAGLSRNFIGLLEAGRQTPSLDSLRSLQEALGVDIESLVTGPGSGMREDTPALAKQSEANRRRVQKLQKLFRLLERSSPRQMDTIDSVIRHILNMGKEE